MLTAKTPPEFDSSPVPQHITRASKSSNSKPQGLPNLFFAGAAKSGTTTLWHYFKNHPEVFLPKQEVNKEPCYFSEMANLAKHSKESYLGLFAEAGSLHKYIGEASHAYLTDPQSAKRIHRFNPQAKIVLILRNPIDRAYSLFNWMRQEGYEWAHSFEHGLELESWRAKQKLPNLLHPNYYYNYLYYQSGKYSTQVKRFIDLFGKEQVLVLTFKELKEAPQKTIDSICDFLAIQRIKSMPVVKNTSMDVVSGKAQFALRLFTISRMVLEKRLTGKRYISKAERDKWIKLGLKNTRPKPLKKSTRTILKKKYKDDIAELSRITGKDFSFWLD